MRLSIRAKMITTSALLVAFVVVVFAFISDHMARRDLAEDSTSLSERRQQASRQLGLLLSHIVARGSLPLVADYQIPNLNNLVTNLVAESDRSEVEIIRAAILDSRNHVLVWAPGEEQPVFEPGRFGLDSFDQVTQPRVFGEQPAGTEPSGFIVIAPIHSDDLVLGHTVIEFGAGPVLSELDEIQASTAQRIAQRQRNTWILGGLAVLLGIFIAILQSLGITNPIHRLAGSAEKIAAGDLEVRVPFRGKDEIGRLGESFNHMADRLKSLLSETAEKATMQKELEVARIIQETLLPPSGLIKRDPLHIYGYFRSASVCGGDFWNVMDLADGRTLVVVGDVSGHGIPSAMIAAAAKSSLDTIRNISGKNLSLTFLLEEMNRTIFASAKRKFVMSFFALAFDRPKNELYYANAGHNFPLLVRRKEGEPDIRGLVARGNRLGDVENSRYMEQRLALQPGDLIALFTDGVIEYRNREGEEYGERRFRQALSTNSEKDAPDIGTAVLRDLSQFAAQAPQGDDVTLIVIKVGQPFKGQAATPTSSPAV
ncbi:MAG: SpoIIE family protein phosphatase [Bradymonadales bacterium]|nr:SpoIIE family protein phosphatase [Bradymonadales bacterium]